MANLPKSSVEPKQPFSYCAVDCSAPWYAKKAGEKSKGTESYSLVWSVLRLK